MMNKKILIIGLIITVLGLAGVLVLVSKNQDNRNKAAGETNTITLTPTDLSGAVGDVKTVSIWINTPAKISTAKVKLCYGNALILTDADIKDVPGTLLTATNYKTIKDNCVTISKHIDNSLPMAQWPTGSVQFVNIDFKLQASGTLQISSADSILAGDLNGQPEVSITSVGSANVVVDGTSASVNDGTMSLEGLSYMGGGGLSEIVNLDLFLDSSKSYGAVDFKLCYGDKLVLPKESITKGSDFTEGILMSNDSNCLRYIVTKTGDELTGKKKIASLTFVASKTGSGTFKISQADTMFSGAVGGKGVTYKVNNASASYSIGTGGGLTCSPTSNNSTGCSNNFGCMRITGNYAGIDGVCSNPVKAGQPGAPKYACDTECPRISDAVLAKLQSDNEGEGNNKACDKVCNNQPVTGNLNFKFTLAGIRPDATCLSSLGNLTVEVANVPTNKYQGDLTTAFTPISGTEGIDSKGNQIFEVKSLVLDNSKFGGVDNLNYVKIKGPFHLKGRMCKDGQTAKIAESVSCNIDLTKTDYVYDFSEYALFSGDIKLDGAINSIDFSILKTNMAKANGKVGCGQEGDLDLNGKLNSLDADLLKASLLSRDDE